MEGGERGSDQGERAVEIPPAFALLEMTRNALLRDVHAGQQSQAVAAAPALDEPSPGAEQVFGGYGSARRPAQATHGVGAVRATQLTGRHDAPAAPGLSDQLISLATVARVRSSTPGTLAEPEARLATFATARPFAQAASPSFGASQDDILFARGSSTLYAPARESVERAASGLKRILQDGGTVEVIGRADATGQPTANYRLALRRVAVVLSALKRAGVDVKRIGVRTSLEPANAGSDGRRHAWRSVSFVVRQAKAGTV
ncbi:hypothetical protein BKK80_35120 (plasmid) [Cupriavidus malaysiensis]|uniref:OmpA-like domain-containing protein n=1 Tax=Cupriavidus malaysiensis TaxID=367825 RepID=A0A1D9IGF6_9BURK|nr:hypothetical protein BKK80_35120 [Cupriavidus malaysiensis]